MPKKSSKQPRGSGEGKVVRQVKKVAKTGAERSREYRARVKALENAVIAGRSQQSSQGTQELGNNHRQFVVQVDVHQQDLSTEGPSTSTMHMLPGTSNTTVRTKSTTAKTSAERVRAYRERKKALKMGNQQSVVDRGHAPVDDLIVLQEEPEEIINVTTATVRARKRPCRSEPQPTSGTIHSGETVVHDQTTPNIATQLTVDNNTNNTQIDNLELPYSTYGRHHKAHDFFKTKFIDNSFGHICSVCDRLWFKDNLKSACAEHEEILNVIVPERPLDEVLLCNTCMASLKKKKPIMSTYNGFKFPPFPTTLPPLDLVSGRLISPRIPFMQIRRLRHINGQYGIYGQVINVPVCVDTMVKHLPRIVNDDHCINVHIKRRKIHKTSYLHGMINKRTIKTWLEYMVSTPLYTMYDIKIDSSFFNTSFIFPTNQQDDYSEHIPIDESITAQQQTLLWNEDQHLRIAPGEHNVPKSLLFDEHAEELSFPSIYLGQFRRIRDEVNATPFMMATSELRRSDRRAVTPYHLLYVAMKIMRLRVRDALTIAFKHVGRNTAVTREQIVIFNK